ncbi:sugar 3,4-ketoisomerase [Govanella unica]|uniref:FdtA/QdtA family cupin domain-containing protein n=1 Tax=Govanella unica TaxID=2975056 RepID=A0A9X3TVH0_9PROT|nr:FdtA/QdtA family cupin domain-containing protein [Govania unica]MDA5192506.1 FdtA/QdtA family cupin domain-containing protein [Govania unica]
MSLADCQLITLPRLDDERGSLSFLEGDRHIPFAIKRIYYLYDIKPQQSRGAHAHKKCKRVLIPIHGRFTVLLDDGSNRKSLVLSEPNQGLYISPMTWLDLDDFSDGAVCLAVASDYYSEDDYYRDYRSFCDAARGCE